MHTLLPKLGIDWLDLLHYSLTDLGLTMGYSRNYLTHNDKVVNNLPPDKMEIEKKFLYFF